MNDDKVVQDNNEVLTRCVGCIFDDDDCTIGIRQKYMDLGVEVTEDNVIKERMCLYYRTPDWKKVHDIVGRGLDYVELIKAEIQLDVTAILIIKDEHDLADVTTTMRQLEDSLIGPRKVILVNCNREIGLSRLLTWASEQLDISWSIEQFMQGDNYTLAIDTAVKKVKTRWFWYMDAGFKPNIYTLYNTNKLINEDLEQAVVFYDENSVLGLCNFYMLAGGSKEDAIQNKAKRIAEKQNKQYLVRQML